MALKAADPSMDSFRELVVEKLGVPVPTFHTRWLMGQLVVLSRALNFSSVELLIDGLREESAGSDLWSEVAHAITVHETHWLRNAAALKTAVRSFGSDVAQLRILSLGCAYGKRPIRPIWLPVNINPRHRFQSSVSIFRQSVLKTLAVACSGSQTISRRCYLCFEKKTALQKVSATNSLKRFEVE